MAWFAKFVERPWGRRAALCGLFAWLMFGGAQLSWSAEPSRTDSPELASAQYCLVCGTATTASDPQLEIRGRTVNLHAGDCESKWETNPSKYFARLQPQSALFTEEREPSTPLKGPWFWGGVLTVTGLISSAIAAYVAVNRGQAPAKWFFAGLFGNLPVLIALFFLIPSDSNEKSATMLSPGLTKLAVTHAPRPCSGCGTAMHPAANNCSSCGIDVKPLVVSEVPG